MRPSNTLMLEELWNCESDFSAYFMLFSNKLSYLILKPDLDYGGFSSSGTSKECQICEF